MPKKAKKLTDNLVRLYSTSVPMNPQGEPIPRKTYADGDVIGLYLEVRLHKGGLSSSVWFYRQQKSSNANGGKFTLGEYPTLDLTGARSKALQLKAKLLSGINPKMENGLATKQTVVCTLRTASDMWFSHAERINHYKKPCYAYKEKQRFNANVATYIGDIPLSSLSLHDVCRALENCWHKEATRDRSLGTLRNVLTFAVHRGQAPISVLDTVDIRRLKLELGNMVSSDRGQPSLPVDRIPAFMKSLREHDGVPFRLLEFQILCALRSGNARELRWDQVIDLDVPNGAYIKYSREELKVENNGHLCIPLSERAVAILVEMKNYRENFLPPNRQFVFMSRRHLGFPLSEMTACNAIETLHQEEIQKGNSGWIDPIATEYAKDGNPVRVSAHGVARASFRTWASARKEFREKPIELCLHHREKSKVKSAYDRFDYFEERREILNAWANFCSEQ